MVRKNKRGGQRTPAKPAYVATPQGGQRTDGGPASTKQPLRDMPGVPYGQQQELLNQQRAAALPNNQGMRINTQPPAQQANRPNVFASTERPQEAPTAGSPFGPGMVPSMNTESIDITLSAMYEVSKSPIILDLINRRKYKT